MGLDLGSAAFWLAIGGWFIAGSLQPWLRQREVQRTIRAMIEKEGRIDAEALTMIRGVEAETTANASGGWSRVTGRGYLALGIFLAASLLAFFSLMFFVVPRNGVAPPADLGQYAWAAGSFIICIAVGSVVAYLVGRSSKRPESSD